MTDDDALTAGPQVPVDPAAAAALVRAAREHQERFGRSRPLPGGVVLREARAGGRPAERLEPLGAGGAGPAILQLHGGGYAIGSLGSHQALAARVALAARRPVVLVDYRQAPEWPYPAGLDDAEAAYAELAAGGPPPLLVGDSAGGGLALALLLRLRDAGRALSAGAALLSPWLDLGPGACWRDPARRPANPLPDLDPEQLALVAQAYAGTTPLDAPELSPALAPRLDGLPPLLVHVAAAELLRPDAERFARRARAAGADVALRARTGVSHVWHMDDGPDGEAAVADLGAWLASRARA